MTANLTRLAIAAAIVWAALTLNQDDPPERLPWCEGESLVVPGAGIVEFASRCDQPVVHDPPGTGPTTGPNGERHEGGAP